ncbi:MAG: hypothetical protein MZW92_63345 [Comamonadaceae bacterium]|nr:hypothetical protein [Comamonadaceae bacterium]
MGSSKTDSVGGLPSSRSNTARTSRLGSTFVITVTASASPAPKPVRDYAVRAVRRSTISPFPADGVSRSADPAALFRVQPVRLAS